MLIVRLGSNFISIIHVINPRLSDLLITQYNEIINNVSHSPNSKHSPKLLRATLNNNKRNNRSMIMKIIVVVEKEEDEDERKEERRQDEGRSVTKFSEIK